MVEFRKLSRDEQEEIHRRYPEGFTLRDEANALAAFAVYGAIKVDAPLENLQAARKITKAEKAKVIGFARKNLELLIRLRENDPEAYRSMVQRVGFLNCEDWER